MAARRRWRDGMRKLIRNTETSVPVNKGGPQGAVSGRRLPQIDNPLIVGALGVGSAAIGTALESLLPAKRLGRDERFADYVARGIIDGAPEMHRVVTKDSIDLSVHEAFGKPALVNVDITVDAAKVGEWFRASDARAGLGAEELVDVIADEVPDIYVTDVLERMAQLVWDNPEMAPVAVRGRVIVMNSAKFGEKDSEPDPGGAKRKAPRQAATRILADMSDLGFEDEIARPADLYLRFGPPASDPLWRP